MTDQDPQDVFARARSHPSGVTAPSSPWVLVLGGMAIALLAVIVFMTLQHSRDAQTKAAEKAYEAAHPPYRPPPPPPVVVAPATAAPTVAPASQPPAPVARVLSAAPAQPIVAGPDPQAGRRAPAMIIDLSEPRSAAPAPQGQATTGQAAVLGGATAPASDAKLSVEERFAERVSSAPVDTAHASRLPDHARVAPQGTVIPAVLETAIDSDLPGFVRAVVSRDVRAFDGVHVLIPRGSKLIGQYRSGVAAGQSRAFVVWSRVLTPDGVSIEVGSPGADTLGRGGLSGETDNHFFHRFGASILLSVLGAGLQAAANNNSNTTNTAIVIGSPQQASSVAQIALQKEIDIPPTIKIRQGEPIRVFVARDLDFSTVK